MCPFWFSIRYWLTLDENQLVLCGCLLDIPKQLRCSTLQTLHASHQGMEQTKRCARLAIYWPWIEVDIEGMICGCHECTDALPSQGPETLRSHAEPKRVLQHIRMDPFSYGGHNFLVVVDVKSGWPTTYYMEPHVIAETIIDILREFFCDTAVPTILYLDNGRQMDSHKFENFLTQWGVKHVISFWSQC